MSAPNLKRGQVAARIVVTIHQDNALSVEGPTGDKPWCIAALQNAIDAVKNQNNGRELIVPGKDVTL